jgi:hypothetical protein
MAVSSGLASVFKGIGSGYLNAMNQGRRERVNYMTNAQRIRSDRSRNAIEALKLQAMQDENRLKRGDAALDRDYKYANLNQGAINNALGEIANARKQWEGLDEESIKTNVAALRNSLFQALGQDENLRPYGLSEKQIAGMLPMPGEAIPGQFTQGMVPGAVVDQGQGRGGIEGIMSLDAAAKEFPGVRSMPQGMEFNPESGRYETFSRQTLSPQQQGMVGLYGPPNINALPQGQQDLGVAAYNMRGVPDSRFRKPSSVIPKDVVAFGEREATEGQVPVTAKYGMRAQTEAGIKAKTEAANLTRQRAADIKATLAPRLGLLEQKIAGLKLSNAYMPLKFQLQQAALAAKTFATQVAASAEAGRESRFKRGLDFKEREFRFNQGKELTDVVENGVDALGKLRLTESNASAAYSAALQKGDKAGAAKLQGVINDVRALYDQTDKWIKESTGNPQVAAVNVANDLASIANAQRTLSVDPTNPDALRVMAESTRRVNSPYLGMNFGSTAPLGVGQFFGTTQGLSPAAIPYLQDLMARGAFSGGRSPDSAGAFGTGGGANYNPPRKPTGGGVKPTKVNPPKPVQQPKPNPGGGPKPLKPGQPKYPTI